MGKEIEDENFLAVIVDGRDQSEIVSGNVENGNSPAAPYFHLVGVGECLSGVHKISPRG
jgi:hypothetical protein